MFSLPTLMLVAVLCFGSGDAVVVGFTATYNSVNKIDAGKTVVFDKVLSNHGNAYNPSTGVFICPVNGLYSFSVEIVPNTMTSQSFLLMSNNFYLFPVHVQYAESALLVLGKTIVTKCLKGNSVYLRSIDRVSLSYVNHPLTGGFGRNFFSGFLIGEI